MAQHRNPSIAKDTDRIFNTKGGENLTEEVFDSIVPVVPLHPIPDLIRSISAQGTVYTVPTDKDFYLTSWEINGDKTALQTGTVLQLQADIDGTLRAFSQVTAQTSTAERVVHSRDLIYPMKLTRGSAVSFIVTGTWTNSTAIIQGFHRETTK